MKKLLFSLVAFMLMSVTSALAQTSLVATLSHDGKLSTYYGADALGEAYEDAVDGDVITLSSGSFKAVNIKKSITLHGAGMSGNATVLIGEFDIHAKTIKEGKVVVEGVQCPNKVQIRRIEDEGGSRLEAHGEVNLIKSQFLELNIVGGNLNLVQCKVYSKINSSYSYARIYCINSAIRISANGDYENEIYTFLNCIVMGYPHYLCNSIFENTIIFIRDTSKGCSIKNSCETINCLGIRYFDENLYGGNIFENINSYNCHMLDKPNDVFKQYLGDVFYSDWQLNDWVLLDNVASTYLGGDGTQVGIYGGNNPFDPVPSSAQVKRFSVKTSEKDNGNISVTINVE